MQAPTEKPTFLEDLREEKRKIEANTILIYDFSHYEIALKPLLNDKEKVKTEILNSNEKEKIEISNLLSYFVDKAKELAKKEEILRLADYEKEITALQLTKKPSAPSSRPPYSSKKESAQENSTEAKQNTPIEKGHIDAVLRDFEIIYKDAFSYECQENEQGHSKMIANFNGRNGQMIFDSHEGSVLITHGKDEFMIERLVEAVRKLSESNPAASFKIITKDKAIEEKVINLLRDKGITAEAPTSESTSSPKMN